MKRIIAMLLVVAMSICVLASCGGNDPVKVKVRFVDWDTTSRNEVVIYETELSITTSNPSLYTVLSEAEKANSEIAAVYGEDANGEPTVPVSYFGREEHDDKDVSPIVLYRWNVYVSSEKAPNENSDTVSDWNAVIKDGETVTFAYLHWENQTDY